MILGEAQTFASPEEALVHYGVKGMRWGVRNKDRPVGRESSGRVASAPKTVSGRAISVPVTAIPKLSEKKQRRVDKFLKRADVADTKIAELKVANEALQGTRNVAKLYNRRANKLAIKELDKEQRRALRDAEAVQKGKLTSTQKKVIVGAVAVTAIVGAAAVYRGQQSGAINSYKLIGQARLRGQKVPFNMNGKLRKPMSADDLLTHVAKPVNPGYSKMGGKMNCRRSTYAYELRRRGFDVHATTSAVGWGQSESGVINALTPGSENLYRRRSVSSAVVETGMSSVARGDRRTSPTKILLDNLTTAGSTDDKASAARLLANVKAGRPIWEGINKESASTVSSSKRVLEELAKQPNGARGEVLFKFPSFGHSMAYEVVDGVPHIFDSQKGQLYNAATKMVESKWDGFTAAEIRRLDNVDLDLNFLTRWATNVRGK
jgi:hypothetical protein